MPSDTVATDGPEKLTRLRMRRMAAGGLFVAMCTVPQLATFLGYGEGIGEKTMSPFGLLPIYTGTASVSSISFILLYGACVRVLASAISPRHRSRLVTASFWIPFVISLLLFFPLGMQLFLIYITLFGALEYRDILAPVYPRGPSGAMPSAVPLCVAMLVLAVTGLGLDMRFFSGVLVLCFGVLSVCYSALYGERARQVLSLDFVGLVYVSFLLNLVFMIMRQPHGLGWVFVGLSTSWIGDGGAYFVGSKYGRHKVLPQVSPGKSWEGIAAELFFTWATALGMRSLHVQGVTCLNLASLSAMEYFPVAVGLTFSGVTGDLCESFLKRFGGKKDSGNFFPGHGGVLDRFDGFFFACSFLSIYVTMYPEKG